MRFLVIVVLIFLCGSVTFGAVSTTDEEITAALKRLESYVEPKQFKQEIKNLKKMGLPAISYLLEKYFQEEDILKKYSYGDLLKSLSWAYTTAELQKLCKEKDPGWALLGLMHGTNFADFGFLTWVDYREKAGNKYFSRTIPNNVLSRALVKQNLWALKDLPLEKRGDFARLLGNPNDSQYNGSYGNLETTNAGYAAMAECSFSIIANLGGQVSLGVNVYLERIENLVYIIGLDDWAGEYEAQDTSNFFYQVKLPLPIEEIMIERLSDWSSDDNPELRKNSALALSGSVTAEAITALKSILDDKDEEVRAYAKLSLGKRGVK